MIGRDLHAIPDAVRAFRRTHSSEQLFEGVIRFAILAFAPSQHGKHAFLACLAARELREAAGERYDELLTECAIYAAASRPPWSEPPVTDPPPIDRDEPHDRAELRAAIHSSDRLRGERWLAANLDSPSLAADLFSVAADDPQALGDSLIVAVTAWKAASLLDPRGRYAALRTAIVEMTAANPSAAVSETPAPVSGDAASGLTPLFAGLIEATLAESGSPVAAERVFLLDAAIEAGLIAGDESITDRVRAALHGFESTPVADEVAPLFRVPIYTLARDYAMSLRALALFARIGANHRGAGFGRFVAAADDHREHGPSYEDFSFA